MSAAIVVLGMHRSGTSCVAAMLCAAGGVVAGTELRNWDNPRGHRELDALVRLNDDVLAHSGGHWLAPPPIVAWTEAQAAQRDALLAVPGPQVLKDPRTLLVWPFWRSAAAAFHRLGVVRHPLAVARSLHAWRGTPIDEGLRLWRSHVAMLVETGSPVVCFDVTRDEFIARVTAIAQGFGLPALDRLAEGYAPEAVHHDAGDGPDGDAALVADCIAVYHRAGGSSLTPHRRFPWAALDRVRAALAGDEADAAVRAATEALDGAGDSTAVIAPIAQAFLRAHRGAALVRVLDAATLPAATALLVRGKALLDAGRADEAADALEAACAAPGALHEARHVLPVALWACGRHDEADAALAALATTALYPFRVLARRAEWRWQRGERDLAMQHLDAAIAAAPPWRHGRLLHRRAAWREALGDSAGAAEDRALASARDPSYTGRNRRPPHHPGTDERKASR